MGAYMVDPIKVAYLFGAGSAHGERTLECKIQNTGFSAGKIRIGLTSEHVSKAVVKELFKDNADLLARYGIDKNWDEPPSGPKKVDIELLISMIEALKTIQAETDAKVFRKYFYDEINKGLHLKKKKLSAQIHAALLEWHALNLKKEEVVGWLSVNYDSMFEDACERTKTIFDYGFDVDTDDKKNSVHKKGACPFLKLHGSFDWKLDAKDSKVKIVNNIGTDEMLWIPPRLNKDYLGYPYNILQGRAEEILRGCDVLRIVGCSLSQNDLGLISLIFRTQKTGQGNRFTIEYIGSDKRSKDTYGRLGALLTFDEESFYTKPEFNILVPSPTDNYLLDWLNYQVKKSKKNVSATRYLKNVKKWSRLI
jgi:hypothetical protein